MLDPSLDAGAEWVANSRNLGFGEKPVFPNNTAATTPNQAWWLQASAGH